MSELTENLTKQLEQEIEDHNQLAQNIAQANEELLVRRGGIQKLQEIIQKETSKELAENPEEDSSKEDDPDEVEDDEPL